MWSDHSKGVALVTSIYTVYIHDLWLFHTFSWRFFSTIINAPVQLFFRVCQTKSWTATNFTSGTMKQPQKELGIRYIWTTPYHPQTENLVERFNQLWPSQAFKNYFDQHCQCWLDSDSTQKCECASCGQSWSHLECLAPTQQEMGEEAGRPCGVVFQLCPSLLQFYHPSTTVY